jgi:aminoglycoside/choline kinase family phosphotransferase
VSALRTVLDPRIEAFLGERGRAPRIEALSGDASTRQYFRLLDGRARVVLALHPEPFDPATNPFLAVRGLLAGYGLSVPAVLDRDGERGILLLEDLGDRTLQLVLAGASESLRLDLYREACAGLLRLRREAARDPQRASCITIAFDIEKLSWELHYFVKHFVEGLRGARLSVEDRATLGESIHGLCHEIASWPRVLCHRDFHSRNLMLHGGRLFWIDFQDARMGPGSYDLASLLRDSYVDLAEDFVADRAEEFRQQAAPEEPREQFARRFDLVSVQRNLKALGTFGYMKMVRGTDVYQQHVPRTLKHARRNLARYPELRGLRRVLAAHIEELG